MNTDHQFNSPNCSSLSERPIVRPIRPSRRPESESVEHAPDVHPARLVLGQLFDQVEIFGSDGSTGSTHGGEPDGSPRDCLSESTRQATRSMNVELRAKTAVSDADLLLSAYLFAGSDDGPVVVGEDARSADAGQDFVHESLWAVLGQAAARWDSSHPSPAPPA